MIHFKGNNSVSTISEAAMRNFLSKSISSGKSGKNLNKIRGLLAEVEFRTHLQNLGYGERVSPGGWIARRNRDDGQFGRPTCVFFPEVIEPGVNYALDRDLPQPPLGLHTICATFHQTGIAAYYCAAKVGISGAADSIRWFAMQLGVPAQQPYVAFPDDFDQFVARSRKHNFLSGKSDASNIPSTALAEEFSKEHLRVAFQSRFFSEIADVDGVFWGHQHTYPVEIKEKTVAHDASVGHFFGLDLGPFVKLAFYAAKKGNLHSLFVVREIDNVQTRALVDWWFITFEQLARYASWTPKGGGTNMGGGGSTVVQIPKSEFTPLTAAALDAL